jgi:glutamyl-tRNA reductase
MLDLAVPRNVDPAARALANVQLLDLDDLERDYCPAAGLPSIAVADAERIIEDEIERLGARLQARAAAPKLAQLHRLGEQLAREEADRAITGLHHLSDMERQIVRDMARRLVRRVLYPVSRRFRDMLPVDTEGARWTA